MRVLAFSNIFCFRYSIYVRNAFWNSIIWSRHHYSVNRRKRVWVTNIGMRHYLNIFIWISFFPSALRCKIIVLPTTTLSQCRRMEVNKKTSEMTWLRWRIQKNKRKKKERRENWMNNGNYGIDRKQNEELKMGCLDNLVSTVHMHLSWLTSLVLYLNICLTYSFTTPSLVFGLLEKFFFVSINKQIRNVLCFYSS